MQGLCRDHKSWRKNGRKTSDDDIGYIMRLLFMRFASSKHQPVRRVKVSDKRGLGFRVSSKPCTRIAYM